MTELKRCDVTCDQCKAVVYVLREADDGGFPREVADPRTDGFAPPVALRYGHDHSAGIYVFCDGRCAALHLLSRAGAAFPLFFQLGHMLHTFPNAQAAADWLRAQRPYALSGGVPLSNLAQWI